MDARLIGRRVQTLRRARGLTQEQLSQMVELSPNYLSNIETGLKTPKLETLVRLMNALQCDANALLADVVDTTVSQESGQFSGALAELRPEDQRRIRKVLEVLIQDAKDAQYALSPLCDRHRGIFCCSPLFRQHSPLPLCYDNNASSIIAIS